MVPLTLIVALIGIGLVSVMRPSRGLAVLILSMMLYPEYLRIPMGLAQMSAPRLIGIALVIRCLCSQNRKLFRWRTVDALVVGWWIWDVSANLVNGSSSTQQVWVIGRFFDTVLMYFAARLSLVYAAAVADLVVPLAWLCIYFGIIGAFEAETHRSFYHYFEPYFLWARWGVQDDVRNGFLRARGSSGLPAAFGVALMITTGLLFALRGYTKKTWLVGFGVGLGILGVAASLSSGPMLVALAFVLCGMYYYMPKLIRPSIIGLILVCVAAEVFSNRRFYYLIEYLNIFGGDYWYRCRLLDVALDQLSVYWKLGIGPGSTDYWGPLIDGRGYADLVNQYVNLALSSGVMGAGLYIGFQVLCIRDAVRRFRTAPSSRERILAFYLVSLLIAIMLSGFQVSVLGAPNLLSFIVMGAMPVTAISASAKSRATFIRRGKNGVETRAGFSDLSNAALIRRT